MLDGLDDREHLVEVVGDLQALDVLRRDVAAREHRAAQPVDQAAASSRESTSTIGKWRILPVWRSVAASNSSSSVPKPPGKTTNPLA